ncbi:MULTISPECIES: hypothetical protein [Serratia]|uniref:hypothetical protein n=1 Tax=Serratia TaxID=613 RepID=UPI00101F3CB0|nr:MULTISPECIES: hypothetical protein [Serratia]TXE64936.1 hypothetical protein FOT59_25590 [Serratia nevei]
MQQNFGTLVSNRVTSTPQTRPGMAVTDELPETSTTQHTDLEMNNSNKKKPEKRKDRLASLQLNLLENLEFFWRSEKNAVPQEHWPSTRQLAERCDLGIYQTRHLLLKLVEDEYVQLAPKRVKNTLRWNLSESYKNALLLRDDEKKKEP